jgi:hypothetical protein
MVEQWQEDINKFNITLKVPEISGDAVMYWVRHGRSTFNHAM